MKKLAVLVVSVTSVLETGVRQRDEGAWDSLTSQSRLISGLVGDPILEKHSGQERQKMLSVGFWLPHVYSHMCLCVC